MCEARKLLRVWSGTARVPVFEPLEGRFPTFSSTHAFAFLHLRHTAS
jgi:hypothetical protein